MVGMRTVLVTGGAGFVGSNLALMFKRDSDARVVALDNLKRRGSELCIERLKQGGVEFLHGDIRCLADIEEVGRFDLLIDCAAEPSVQAAYGGSPAYLVDANLVGTLNCLEMARRHGADFVFLSTSRVYPIAGLRALPLAEGATRLEIPRGAGGPGWSAKGIAADFPLAGHRSLYGATKLSAELILEEFGAMYGLRSLVNRCGILTGPWQMGKVDQGVVVLWAARHFFGGKLAYMGFGGHGHQVRDMLHVADLYDLLRLQLADIDRHKGRVYNVGGGLGVSVSLAELTEQCRRLSGGAVEIARDPETKPSDIPWYVTDNAAVGAATGWAPRRSVETILDEIFAWLRDNRERLAPVLA